MESFQELEIRLAEWSGCDPAQMVVCSSGTAALHLVFEALALPQGSEVLMSDFNMIACPRAAVMAGLKPKFLDCNTRLLIDQIVMTVTPLENTKAILATHIYGRQCNMDNVCKFADWNFLKVVEDLAESHGVRPHRYTDAATWSFFKNKIIFGEEGGAAYFKNLEHAALARRLRNMGFTEDHDFTHVPRGHNYRMANCCAELILKSLSDFQKNIEARREIESWCDEFCPPAWKMPPRQSPWVYDMHIPDLTENKQNEIVRRLQAVKIPARHAFKQMSKQLEFYNPEAMERNAVARRMSREVIYLPLTPGLLSRSKIKMLRAFKLIQELVG